jgi:zinc finger protein
MFLVSLEEFKSFTAENIESLCVQCEEDGITKFLMTDIPFFKCKSIMTLNYLISNNILILSLEIIISSFACEHCGYKNSEVQFGGKIGDNGVEYTLNVVNPQQLNRQIVKSEQCSIRIPALELEIPAKTQKGTINTIEGFLYKTIEGLNQV